MKRLWFPFLACLMAGAAENVPAQLAQQAYVKASNSGENARFGAAVALDGNTLVVGAFGEESNATGIDGNQDDTSLFFAGAVYVFTRSGGAWEQQAYIKASNTESDDEFGTAVAVSGDTLVVGAPGEDSAADGVNGNQDNNGALDAGAVYVFVREGGTWRQQAYLKASNSGNPDRFGHSVAIDGDTLVVGAPQEGSKARGVDGDQGDDSSLNAGAAYVFSRTGETWTQQAYLKASNTDSLNFDYAQDFFGFSVGIDEDTIAVGAYGEDSAATGVSGEQENESAPFSGAVYVFVREAGEWSQQAYLKASNTDPEDQFGYSVSIHGDRLVAGANFENSSSGGVNGDETDNSYNFAGAAYAFTRIGGSWTQSAYLKASQTGNLDHFGAAVSVFGNAIVVGAWGEASSATGINGNDDDNSFPDAGAAYLFVQTGNAWHQEAYIKASNTGRVDLFGQSVTISGSSLAVGAQLERSDADGINGDQTDDSVLDAGAAYVFADPALNAPSLINAGFNDAWYNPATDGQGFFITVFPAIQQMFLAWFTYDTERPPQDVTAMLGEPGHRWITAYGPYSGDTATLDIELTEGGVFDAPEPIPEQTPSYGTITLKFSSCEAGEVVYDIPEAGVSGVVPIQRIALDNVPRCETLRAQ